MTPKRMKARLDQLRQCLDRKKRIGNVEWKQLVAERMNTAHAKYLLVEAAKLAGSVDPADSRAVIDKLLTTERGREILAQCAEVLAGFVPPTTDGAYPPLPLQLGSG